LYNNIYLLNGLNAVFIDIRKNVLRFSEFFIMKKDIHPTRHAVTAHCACGYEFETHSTSPDLKVTLCSHCHPFYTGAQKFVDTAGRIEKFEKKYKKNNQEKKKK